MDNKKSLRIGIDCRLWNETGVGRYIQNLLTELVQIAPDFQFVLFVLPKDKEDVSRYIQSDRFEIIPADVRWHSLKEQLVFPFILYKSNCDLIHFPYFSVPLLYSKPFVLTIHDMITWQFATGKASTLQPVLYWFKQLVYRFVISSGAKRAKKIFAVSESTKTEIIKNLHVSPEKIIVTYEGVSRLFTEPKKADNKSFPDKYFLCVGNAYPHKNFERLIEAFAIFSTRHSREGGNPEDYLYGSPIRSGMTGNINLVFVGKDNYFYDRLKRFVAEKRIINVLFVGYIPDEELYALYRNAIATVVPSLMEGFGLPALEAMTAKSIVAASDIPVFREVCGDIPVYFNPKSITDIAEKLIFVATSKKSLLDEKRAKGVAWVKQFSWKKMAELTVAIYESSIGIRQSE